jgi:DeoR/GlpR family transcriptional regulator of sugar metabolism
MLEMTPIERSAKVAFMLASGMTLTPKEVAELTECRPDTARRLLNKLARVLPLAENCGAFVLISSQR